MGSFVAVPGEHVDGHDFAAAAVAAGAAGVLGARPTGVPTVVVDDPVRALGRLARHVVDTLRPTVLALTGSQGKTGTKDFLAQVLAAAGETVWTEGNRNNEIGVPLTVLRATPDTRFLVLEMGARGIGHIAELCAIAPPDVAAVLNVGTAHIGEFGSREAIASAKGEIVEALPSTGTAVLNADDDLVAAMARRTSARVLSFGVGGDVAWRGLELDELGRPSFELGYDGAWAPLRLLEAGAHQVANAAAAAAMALAVGVPFADIVATLGSARSLSPVADGAPRAGRRPGRRQRQLQRQPRLHERRARRARRDRRARRPADGGGARRDARARRDRGRAARRGRRPRGGAGRRRPGDRRHGRGGDRRRCPSYPGLGRERSSPRRAASRRRTGCATMSGPGTSSWSRRHEAPHSSTWPTCWHTRCPGREVEDVSVDRAEEQEGGTPSR